MKVKLESIREKIAAQALVLLPTVEEQTLRAFEEQFQLELPEAYKAFLSQIGSGFENTRRLLSPKDWEESFWTKPQGVNPFSYPCQLNWEHEFSSEWTAFINDPEHQQHWQSGQWDPMFGTIAIGEIGCGLYYRMILNGPLKDTIFIWGDHALNPPKFQAQVGYLDWLAFHIDACAHGFSWLKT